VLEWLFHFNGDCTLWLDRLLWWDWSACCRVHDLDYSGLVPKDVADARLGNCVNAVLRGMGDVMWAGVTVAGGLWYARARAQKGNAK